MSRARRNDYRARSDERKYFDDAAANGTAFVFHVSPKYPVYRVDFEAVATAGNVRYPKGTRARVLFLVANAKISTASDYFDSFWSKATNQRSAIALGKRLIRAEHWRVTAVKSTAPLSYRAAEGQALLRQYYEEAEADGECLAFWPDSGARR